MRPCGGGIWMNSTPAAQLQSSSVVEQLDQALPATRATPVGGWYCHLMAYAELELARVYYESTGHGAPLIFAHGAGGNALSWWQQTAFFSARYRCITFDHPGFRFSEWLVPGDDASANYGNVLGQFLDHLGIESAAFVAQSMGGWSCLRLAIDAPDRVSALVMAATDGGLYLPDRSAYSGQEARLDEIRARWRQQAPGSYHPAAGQRMMAEQPALHDMYVEIGRQNDGVSRRGWGANHVHELARIRCPALFVTGEEDVVCDPARVVHAHDAVKGSRLWSVPSAGHSVYFEHSELFNRAVDEFLGEVCPAGAEGPTIIESFTNQDEA